MSRKEGNHSQPIERKNDISLGSLGDGEIRDKNTEVPQKKSTQQDETQSLSNGSGDNNLNKMELQIAEAKSDDQENNTDEKKDDNVVSES